jgi:hypothetical protein
MADLESIRALLKSSASANPAPTKVVAVTPSPPVSGVGTPDGVKKSNRTFYLMLAALSLIAMLLLYQRYQESLAMDDTNAKQHMDANPLTADQIEKLQRAAREQHAAAAPAPKSDSSSRKGPTVEEISSSEEDDEPSPPPVRKKKKAQAKGGGSRRSTRLGKRKAKVPEPVPEDSESETEEGAGVDSSQEEDPNFRRIEETSE